MSTRMRVYWHRRRILLSSLFLSTCLCLYFSHRVLFSASDSLPDEIQHWQKVLQLSNRSSSLKCEVPQLDPWDPSILKYVQKSAKSVNCKWLQYDFVHLEMDRDRLVVNQDNIKCTAMGIFKNIADDNFHYGNATNFVEDSNTNIYYDMKENFVKVDCYEKGVLGRRVYTDFFAGLTPIPVSATKLTKKSNLPNVLLFGIDSMSMSNFKRQMPNTLGYFTDKMNATVLKFKNEVEELYGIFYDKWTFLEWYNYRDAGYLTLFAEDAPLIQTFNYYGMWGFQHQPTHFYLRPLILAMRQETIGRRSSAHCIASRPLHAVQMEWVKRFWRRYSKTHNIFAMNWLQEMSHDHLNLAGMLDDDIMHWFHEMMDLLHDSVVVFYSDHGHRYADIRQSIIGRIEARLPGAIIYLGAGASDKWRENLRMNADRLTTPFDIHATLVHLRGGDISELKGIPLFTGHIPLNRTCDDAYIPTDMCACLDEVQLSIENDFSILTAGAFVDLINSVLDEKARGKCHQVQLDRIIDVRVSLPKNSVFVDPQVAHTAASSGYKLFARIVIGTVPNEAQFEALLSYDLQNKKFALQGASSANREVRRKMANAK